ncbi:hypothetical protein [Clostridium manihotivorum]|uniref:Uncharacterized protein n=1 Tax=Clostridium manihotivorum TaxID=2320868 RepID=A0A3R5UBR2_9CLOT|nr:hypothetical protein [Clostridium manihotivorum]QAA35046.1 hypothetical protein C1I91_27270 [Clostridium manihotivorum]
MESPYKELIARLKKVKARIFLRNFFKNICIGFIASTVLSIAVALISRFTPIYGVYFIWFPWLYTLGFFTALVVTIILAPKLLEVSKIVDNFGLEQRVSTAMELMEQDNVYKSIQAEDALDKFNKLDYKNHIKLIPAKKLALILLAVVIVLSSTFLLPDTLKDEANRLHALNGEKKEEVKKVEQAKKEINENKKLTEQQKKELLSKVDELKKDIALAKTNKEIDKAKEKLAKKLDIDKNKQLDRDLEKLAEGLKQNEATKKLSEAIKENDQKKLDSELDKLKKDAKSMDSKQKEALKNSLSNTSSSMSSGDMKSSLDELSDALSSGDEAAINKSIDSVKGSLSKANGEKNKNQALASLQKQLDQEQQLAEANDQNDQDQANGSGNGSGQGAGQGSGQGQGQGSGSGQGNGSGSGGRLAGNGTSNGSNTVSPYSNGSGIGNKQPGSSKEKEYEKVFTPSRLGGEGKTSSLNGKSGNSGSSESEITDKANATLGELKPYDQVVGEYSKEAMDNMENYQIPDGMTEIIKGYFSSLQQ